MTAAVRVTDLSVATAAGRPVLDGARLTLAAGTITALTGPSGAGKSTLLRAVLGDLAPGLVRTGGTVDVLGHDVFALPARQRQRFRRAHLAYVGQDPGAALNPTMRVAALLAEAAGTGDRALLLEALDRVRLSAEHLRRRPGELSGGQQRRLALARALVRRPDVLLVDEPMAGLDARLRRDVGEVLRCLARDGVTVAVSGHDITALTALADAVTALGGPVPATAPVARPRTGPPRIGPARIGTAVAPGPVLLAGRGLGASVGRATLLRDVDVTVPTDGATAIVGASGAGKTTLARVVAGLHPERTGSLELAGVPLAAHARRRTREQRRRIQLIPQDPLSTLNPRRTAGSAVARPLALHRLVPRPARPARVAALLAEVGLPDDVAGRYPHELSGGQRQRVAIARALAAEPALLVCDEITSAVDRPTADAIMDLLRRIRAARGLALIVISHDLPVVREHCDHVVVLHAGAVVEAGPAVAVLGAPAHPVTAGLLDVGGAPT